MKIDGTERRKAHSIHKNRVWDYPLAWSGDINNVSLSIFRAVFFLFPLFSFLVPYVRSLIVSFIYSVFSAYVFVWFYLVIWPFLRIHRFTSRCLYYIHRFLFSYSLLLPSYIPFFFHISFLSCHLFVSVSNFNLFSHRYYFLLLSSFPVFPQISSFQASLVLIVSQAISILTLVTSLLLPPSTLSLVYFALDASKWSVLSYQKIFHKKKGERKIMMNSQN